MSGLKHLRNRVKSIKSTQKTTKAMQIVSAAKLNKLKDRAARGNDFSYIFANLMNHVLSEAQIDDLPQNDRCFFSKSLVNMPHLLIVMTSERGLCGGFNSSVLKKLKQDLKNRQDRGEDFKLIVIGKKGYDALKNLYQDKIDSYYNLSGGEYELVASLVKSRIISLVENEEVGACFMYYNMFKNAMTQVMTVEQILPALQHDEYDQEGSLAFEFEGDGLVRSIVNLYIQGEVNYALLQSRASEEGARMSAMDNSTKNAGEIIDKLTLKLNRSRQAMITTELTEIISGAEAV